MPLVSIIVPCYNEQDTIRLLLEAICRQTFLTSELEVVIADGRSTDRTREEIAAFQREHPELLVRVVDNPRRNIPAGLNRALAAAQGKYVVRLDAHSAPDPDYIQHCVADLEAGRGENVGGVWDIRPRGSGVVQRAIAIAAAHPLGVGDALYRYTTKPGYVDTIPFGAFRRDVFDRLGAFDESLLTNEDYEFNARLRRQGGRVWLNPRIRSTYFARPNLGALARQYARYGYWKLRMLARYPQTLRWRQALPPAFIFSLVGLLLVGLVWPAALGLLIAEILVYFLILMAGSARAALRERDWRLALLVPAAMATMHLSWGAGLWWSLISAGLQFVKRKIFINTGLS